MTQKYIALPFPDYQEYMGEEGFREESYYDCNKDVYLIPIDRFNSIRKDIISNLKIYIKCIKDGYDAPSAKNFVVNEIKKQIVWLEKQDNKPVNIDIESMVSSYKQRLKTHGGIGIENNSLLNMYLTAFRRGVENTLEELKLKKFEKQAEQNPYSGVSFEYNGHVWGMCARDGGVEILIDGEIKERVFLDNKPQGKSACEAAKEEKVNNQNCVKSADDIKPKFKIGDWIIDGYVCGQIASIEDDYPCYKIIDFMIGTNTSIPFTIQDKYHLWTIQDAKDGDVLQLGKVTAIFQKCIGNNCKCYCSVCDGEFEIPSQDGDDNIYGCYNATPATKEQHDLLFAKIKEAGYEWHINKKELRKKE